MAFYDEKTISLLLVEDHKDERPVLVLMTLEAIADDTYTPIDPELGIKEDGM